MLAALDGDFFADGHIRVAAGAEMDEGAGVELMPLRSPLGLLGPLPGPATVSVLPEAVLIDSRFIT